VSQFAHLFTKLKSVPEVGAWTDARSVWRTDFHTDTLSIFACIANPKCRQVMPRLHFLREGLLPQ
jgi:hypothetical protein